MESLDFGGVFGASKHTLSKMLPTTLGIVSFTWIFYRKISMRYNFMFSTLYAVAFL